MNPAISMWLWLLILLQAPAAQCTRCGGNHTLSRCTWPPARPESKVE